MKRLIVFVVALIVVTAGFVPAVAYGNEAEQYEERIIEYNLQKSSVDSIQKWIDSDLTDDAGAGSEWYVIALSNHGKYDFSDYKKSLNGYLSENEVGSASSRIKYALTYIAIGDKTNPYINKVLGNSIGEQGIMSLVFGLHLLNNGCISDAYSVTGLIDELLSFQLTDGGFSVTGEYGDVDVTAMTVQALAVHYSDNPAVKSAVDDSLDFLSARQLENGGYSAYGVENPESTAQVVIALSSLGIDAATDKRFIKNSNTVFDGMSSFCLADGSFSHKEDGVSDSTATAQVLCASIAYENMKNGKSPFYIFNQNKNVSEGTTTNAITTETTLTEPTSITETTVFVENTSKITSITTNPDSDTQKTEPAETCENKSDSVRVILISVCVASILICAVLFATKKHKFTVLIIVAAVAVIALVAGISGDNNTDTIGSVTISINCDVIKDKDKSYIPKNGVVLEETEVEIEKGDTVYDVFSEVCQKNKILFSSNMKYIEGINNIYEMDFGKSSGWIYFVNGESPSVGCGSYELADGDKIQWHYTCSLGKDLDIDLEK
ncbi:MAG: DUF4430 domain-containing protein [Ruminococcaceae bacterium]|nr:DUF4430 domain-containing protein [Oscillospiraceae bacterium]